MADKDQFNDEYQFADLDSMSPDSGAEVQPNPENEPPPDTVHGENKKSNVKQKAIIVLVLVVVLMIVYKLIASFFSEKKPPVSTLPEPAKIAMPITAPTPQPMPVVVAPTPSASTKLREQLTALESSQQNVQSGLDAVNNQLGGISNNVNAMSAKIAELSTIINNLSTKVDEQAREIDQMTIRREAKKAHHVPRKMVHYHKYFIQAIIPGRAWLVATNGSTLTVRDGSVIRGYGTVKLIDPNQGRVLTSSGQVIKFSQEDS